MIRSKTVCASKIILFYIKIGGSPSKEQRVFDSLLDWHRFVTYVVEKKSKTQKRIVGVEEKTMTLCLDNNWSFKDPVVEILSFLSAHLLS